MFIRRSLVLQIEAHWGYRPRISLRMAPRVGQITSEGLLVRCRECSGDGLLVSEQGRGHGHR